MDDVRFYKNVIFAPDEVLALYNSTKTAYGVQPAERSFSHDVGSVLGTDENTVFATDMHTKNADGTLVDLSGNDNHGTVNGAVRSNGYFRNGMRFVANCDNIINCGSNESHDLTNRFKLTAVFVPDNVSAGIIIRKSHSYVMYFAPDFDFYNWADASRLSYPSSNMEVGKLYFAEMIWDGTYKKIFVNGVEVAREESVDFSSTSNNLTIGRQDGDIYDNTAYDGSILYVSVSSDAIPTDFNRLAALPLYQFDFSKYPSNTTVYTDFLPYSSARIASGSFKVNDDKLECVTDGQIVFRNAHEFDGDEYIKLTINDTVYAGTGTITQGTTTASIEQGSTLITVDMVAGDTIDSIDVQFREPVE
jgi:hypothetical protein